MLDILLVVLGWLFGTLTPGIAEAIKRPKRKSELAQALLVDMDELRYKAALVADRMRARCGTMTQDSLNLVRKVFDEFTGTVADADFKATFNQLLAIGDTAYIAAQNAPRGESSPYPIKYELPFLAAHLQDLDLFPVSVQAALLRVRGEHHMFNEQVDQVRMFHDRTYLTLSEANYAANQGNYEASLRQMAHRAEALIGAINSAARELTATARQPHI